jgi:hypothetical protein
VEAGRDRQDRGRAEQCHRLQERHQRAGEQRRQRERNGHLPRRHQRTTAEDRGCVLEVAGNAIERIRDQHEDVGKRVAGNDKDQPGQRVDVEQRIGLRIADDGAIELIEQAGVRRRQQFPRDRTEKRRCHE